MDTIINLIVCETNRYAGKVLARCIELCPLFGSRFHVLFSGHARLSLGPATWPRCGLGWISHSLGSSYVALVWPWLDFTFLGVQLRGLGVALVGFHIPNEQQVFYIIHYWV